MTGFLGCGRMVVSARTYRALTEGLEMDTITIRRIDPVDCDCTDCLTGWSVPINRAPLSVFDAYADYTFGGIGLQVLDASSTTEREFDRWVAHAEFLAGE